MTATSSRAVARVVGFAAIVIAAITVAVLQLGGEEDAYEVTAEFRNASQLVGGEMVVVGGTLTQRLRGA